MACLILLHFSDQGEMVNIMIIAIDIGAGTRRERVQSDVLQQSLAGGWLVLHRVILVEEPAGARRAILVRIATFRKPDRRWQG